MAFSDVRYRTRRYDHVEHSQDAADCRCNAVPWPAGFTGTLAGTGTVSGNVTNSGKVMPGDAPGTLTINGNYTQSGSGTLLIDIAGANAGEFSVLNVLGTANLSGLLNPDLLNGFVPTIGESFTFLDYGAVTGTLGIFDRNIDSVAEHWEVSYLPTSAILTVAAGNVSVPDHGSTLLLLTLGLLGVVAVQQTYTAVSRQPLNSPVGYRF